MTTKLIGVKEFRQNIATLFKQATKNNWRFVILNRNQPIFRVEPISKKDAIVEKLAMDIAEAREDVKKGRLYDFEDVCKELGL